MGSLVGTGLRFLYAWLVLAIVNSLWFYPDPMGIVPFVGFLLTPAGAIVLARRGYSAERMGYFAVTILALLIPIGIPVSVLLSHFLRMLSGLVEAVHPDATVTGLVLSSMLPVIVIYGTAYWLVYRDGFDRLKKLRA